MISLSDNQVDHIYDLLISRGISYEKLRDELLDHICCLVESQMEDGAQFHQALQESLHQFGPQGVERTQEATLYLLTLKLRKMKKTASIFGIAGGLITIFATVFKVMHWPGAGILLLLGLAVTALLFMPAALFVNLKTREVVRDKASLIAGFLSGILLIVFALFKIMHWPGAMFMFLAALGVFVFVFIPLNFIKSYRNPENKWFDIGSLTVIVAGIIMVFTLYSFDNGSNAYINSMKNMELEAMNSYKHLSAEINRKNESLTAGHPEMEKPVFATQAVTAYVASVFYQYRNSLLSPRHQHDFAEIEKRLKLLDKGGIDNYPNWHHLKKSAEALLDKNNGDKQHSLSEVLMHYQSLTSDLTNVTISDSRLNELAQSIDSFPELPESGHETHILHINYLNLAEYEMKRHQMELLQQL